jgi:CRP/FNR family transcriptional regulator, anaerobic regulatory protein
MDMDVKLGESQVYTFHPHQQQPSNSETTEQVEWRSAVFPPRQPIYHAGQIADKLFVLESGIVELVIHLPHGRNRIVGLQGPGAVLCASFDDSGEEDRYSHSAVPVRTVRADWVFISTVRRQREAGTSWYQQLLECRCAGLRRAERWIAEFTADNTRCRIARLLAYLADLERKPDAEWQGRFADVELLTCQEFGEAVGVSTETASRVLADFKRAGLLRASQPGVRNRYQIDRRQLTEIAFG